MKRTKIFFAATMAVIFCIISFLLLYNSCHKMPMGIFISIFGLFVTLSTFCASEFITMLFHYGAAKYMVTAAIVSALELAPLPYVWAYSSMAFDPDTLGAYIGSMWKIVAVIFVIVLLLTAGINFVKRRYRLKMNIEKILRH